MKERKACIKCKFYSSDTDITVNKEVCTKTSCPIIIVDADKQVCRDFKSKEEIKKEQTDYDSNFKLMPRELAVKMCQFLINHEMDIANYENDFGTLDDIFYYIFHRHPSHLPK